MYVPAHFEERRLSRLHDLIRRRPLAMLVTRGPDGLAANHLPVELDAAAGPLGTLRAHVARANPLWQHLAPGAEALAVFTGPDGYVSPAWYESKAETGKVVPTWNYVAVHAHGPLRVVEDPAWLRGLVERLTAAHEAGRPHPWRVADAPADWVEQLLRGIVGLEMHITRLEGKWKLSQNRPAADRARVMRELRERGDGASLALAEAMESRERDVSPG